MDLVFARWQMGLSLAFHIIFAVIGMAMPVTWASPHPSGPFETLGGAWWRAAAGRLRAG
jgi:hypothetical protein